MDDTQITQVVVESISLMMGVMGGQHFEKRGEGGGLLMVRLVAQVDRSPQIFNPGISSQSMGHPMMMKRTSQEGFHAG